MMNMLRVGVFMLSFLGIIGEGIALGVTTIPTAFTVDWLSGKTLYHVWYGMGADPQGNAIYSVPVVVEVEYTTDGRRVFTGLLNNNSGETTYGVTTDGLLFWGNRPSVGTTIACSTPEYIEITYMIDGVPSNINLIFFDESAALAYAANLTSTISSVCDARQVVTGSFSMGSQDTLQVELSGTGFGEFDALIIEGAATLDGTLEVILTDGYTPSPGDSFTFLTADSITGQFNNIILPDIGDNSFEVSINDGFAVIMVTSSDTEVTPLPVIVNTTIEGTLDSLTLDVEVSLNADFANNISPTERAARTNSAVYDVFVGALIPSGVAGVNQATWFLLDSANVWGQLSGFPLAKFLGNVGVSSQDHRIVIHILNSVNVRPFVGSTIYIGYGASDTEMLQARRYRSVFVIEEH